MTTPLILLALLMGPYLLLGALARAGGPHLLTPAGRGCLGIALMFLFTGMGHFAQTESMAAMLPSSVPFGVPLVYVTGVIEMAAAIAVLIPRLRRPVGIGLLFMLLSFLPVNIYAAIERVPMGGHAWGPVYLWIRVPLQIVMFWWVWRFAVKAASQAEKG